MSVTRQDRDWKDTNTVLRYLSDRNPFTSDIGLHNISTGVHAPSSFDVDQAKPVRKAIIDDMKGQCVNEYTFRRKNQAVTMDMKSSIKIDGNTVQIDPQLLFQRLALAAKATHDLESVFLSMSYVAILQLYSSLHFYFVRHRNLHWQMQYGRYCKHRTFQL